MNRYIKYTFITLGFIILLLSTSLISLQVGFNYGQKETAKIALKSIDTTKIILNVISQDEVCYTTISEELINNETFYNVLESYVKDSQTYTQLAQLAN
jgi:hypothetical protein